MAQQERDFYDVVSDMDDGKVHFQLTRELRDLVKACCDTQKSGTMTLKIKVKPDGRTCILNADVKSSTPKPATGSTFFFPDETGDLRREDPKQPTLRHLDTKPPAQLKSIKDKPETTDTKGA